MVQGLLLICLRFAFVYYQRFNLLGVIKHDQDGERYMACAVVQEGTSFVRLACLGLYQALIRRNTPAGTTKR